MNSFYDDKYSLLCQREILDILNDICEVYGEIESLCDNMIDNKSYVGKFLLSSGVNTLKACAGSVLALLASEEIIGYDSSSIQRIVAISTASLVGFSLFQRSSRKAFTKDMLEKNFVFDNSINGYFDRLSGDFMGLCDCVSRFVSNSSYTLDEFISDDVIGFMFKNNSCYIEKKKSLCEYDFDYGYDRVNDVFSSCFKNVSGVNDYLQRTFSDRSFDGNLVRRR